MTKPFSVEGRRAFYPQVPVETGARKLYRARWSSDISCRSRSPLTPVTASIARLNSDACQCRLMSDPTFPTSLSDLAAALAMSPVI